MSTEPTTEMMNEAICEFMGGHRMVSGTIHVYKGPDEIEWETGTYLKYHTAWDWLMPVVEKISKIPLLNHDNTPCSDPRDVCHPITFAMPTEDGKQLMFRFKGFGLCIADTLIKAVHEGCYEVVKYHNQQKSTNEQRD